MGLGNFAKDPKDWAGLGRAKYEEVALRLEGNSWLTLDLWQIRCIDGRRIDPSRIAEINQSIN